MSKNSLLSLSSCCDFYFLPMAIQLLQQHLLKGYLSSTELLLHLSKIHWASVRLFLAQYLMALQYLLKTTFSSTFYTFIMENFIHIQKQYNELSIFTQHQQLSPLPFSPYLFEESSFLFVFLLQPGRLPCGILVPRPEIKPAPSAVKARSPNHWTARGVSQQFSYTISHVLNLFLMVCFILFLCLLYFL